MSLPDVPEIREILSQIQLSARKASDQDTAIQIPSPPAVDETGQVNQNAPLWLHYPAETKLPFRRLVERISKDLEMAHHSGNTDFSLFVMSLASLMSRREETVLSRVNWIINGICDGDANLYYILSVDFPEYYKFEIPPFRLGPLRADKLKYNCEKADSDFYTRYESVMRGAWTIERAPQKVRVLDIAGIRSAIFGNPANILSRESWECEDWESIVNGYFSLQNEVLFDGFWTELISAQTPLLALGAPFFDPRPLASYIKKNQVAVFLNLGPTSEGFVAPARPGLLMVDVAGVHERIPNAVKELDRLYNFQGFDNSPLHQSIRVFADFVARARRHEIDGRPNEALLHFVIALELIFGESQAIQRNVSERVALITFRENGKTFDKQRDWIERIYELRSRYVHSGTEITEKPPLDQLRAVCGQVFRCLMRLQAAHSQRQSRDETVLKGWLRELDYLAKGMIAGKQPSESQLHEAFIA
jgi:Apea-like HEPN